MISSATLPLTGHKQEQNELAVSKKRDYFIQYGKQICKALETLLGKYTDEGIENIENIKILKVNPLARFGSPLEIAKLFGAKKQHLQTITELECEIYREA